MIIQFSSGGVSAAYDKEEMQILKSFLDSLAVNVFLGTLPLFGAIVWGLLQNDKRLGRIETNLDNLNRTVGDLRKRATKIETRIEGRQIVLSS